MPMYFCYIARLDSPGFFWDDIPDEKYRTGNTPGPKIIPEGFVDFMYPPRFVEHWMEKGGFEGTQIDWSAWGMIVSKADIEMIWKSYEKDGSETKERWAEIWEQIERLLEDGVKYVWVVMENV